MFKRIGIFILVILSGLIIIAGSYESGNAQSSVPPKIAPVSTVPAIDTAAYSAGDCVGGKMSFSLPYKTLAGGHLKNLLITDKGQNFDAVDVVIFDSNPSASTFTNNAACDVNDADLSKIACIVDSDGTFAAGLSFSNNSRAISEPIDCLVSTSAPGGTFYAVMVAQGTPTFTSTSDLTVKFYVEQ